MSVVPIDSKMPFKFKRPRARNRVLEGLIFFADVARTFWSLALIYCLGSDEPWLFYLMVITQIIGVLLGVLMYYKMSGDYLSCVPVNHKPDVPKIAYIHEMKKVA